MSINFDGFSSACNQIVTKKIIIIIALILYKIHLKNRSNNNIPYIRIRVEIPISLCYLSIVNCHRDESSKVIFAE